MLANIFLPTPSTAEITVEPSFYLPKLEEVEKEGPLLGWVRKYGRDLYPVRIRLDDLITHVVIFGMTGAGKSTTASLLLSDLIDFGMKVLVLDWHSEYRNIIIKKGGLVFTPGKDIAPLTLNPLDPSLSEDLSEHISLVTDIFADIFSFTPSQSYMFIECLRNVYRRCGYQDGSPTSQPTLSMVIQEIERMPIRSAYDNETKLALLRRLKPLTEGQAGKALNGLSTISVEELVNNVVSVELGHFKEQEIRKIFVSIFLKLLYDYRTKKRQEILRHVTLIEEARNIIPVRSPELPPSIGERMVSELRKFGEGLIIISQFPVQVSREILKNAATRIFHRIKDEEDRRIIQGALNLTDEQARYLHYLEPGEAIVTIPSASHAFLMHIRADSDALKPLPDEALKAAMQERFYKSYVEFEFEEGITPMRRLKIQADVYSLLKKNRLMDQEQMKNEMKDYDFYSEVAPVINQMIKKGLVKRKVDWKSNRVSYELGDSARVHEWSMI